MKDLTKQGEIFIAANSHESPTKVWVIFYKIFLNLLITNGQNYQR